MIGRRPRRVYIFLESWPALAAIAAASLEPPGSDPIKPAMLARKKRLRRLKTGRFTKVTPLVGLFSHTIGSKSRLGGSRFSEGPRADAWAVPECRHECRHGSLERPLHGEQHHLPSRGCNF